MCEVDCERSTARSTGEAVKLSRSCFVKVPLDGGDSLLLCGFLAKGSTKWFEEEGWLVHLQ